MNNNSTRPFSSRQIIPLISKLLIYVFLADDYVTLEVGEFLNDIIIDFYLRQRSKYYDN
jgi:Ulp1 family protease